MDISTILTGTNLLLAIGVFVLITVIRAVFPAFFASRLGQRILPVLPLVFGAGGALIGMCSNAKTWQEKLLIGLIAGFASSHLFKIGKTTVIGWGLPDKEPPADTKVDPPADKPADAPADTTKKPE